MSKTTSSNANFNFQQPKCKILQAISFKSKGFCNLFRYVFCLEIKKLMIVRAYVKKSQRSREKVFTKITTITHF
jgi:hypothetical protein